MKTLQECKDQVAYKMKFKLWEDLKEHHSKDGLHTTMGEVAELYSSEKDKEIERLNKLLHDNNNMCQAKLSEQLNLVIPDIKKLKDEIVSLTTQVVEAERKGWNDALDNAILMLGLSDLPSSAISEAIIEIQKIKK